MPPDATSSTTSEGIVHAVLATLARAPRRDRARDAAREGRGARGRAPRRSWPARPTRARGRRRACRPRPGDRRGDCRRRRPAHPGLARTATRPEEGGRIPSGRGRRAPARGRGARPARCRRSPRRRSATWRSPACATARQPRISAPPPTCCPRAKRHRDARLAYGDRAADALFRQGGEFGDNAALLEAVAAYRAALQERTRERVPLDWAVTQNNLGAALATLGERESGTARLEEAVAAYRAALEERTRERVPLDWAVTQITSAPRSGRSGSGRAARRGWRRRSPPTAPPWRSSTRERVPLDWALTQINLGNALQTLGRAGERHGAAGGGGRRLPRRAGGVHPRAGAARLGDDPEQPRQRAPDARGAGERHGAAGGGGRRLPRRAGGTHPRARAARLGDDPDEPRRRARTLGERESGTARLEEAVAAYRAALEECTRERVPLDWARTTEIRASRFGCWRSGRLTRRWRGGRATRSLRPKPRCGRAATRRTPTTMPDNSLRPMPSWRGCPSKLTNAHSNFLECANEPVLIVTRLPRDCPCRGSGLR